ncbi:phosphoribulokinase/uridine kinase [Niveomyces insectorum RCEF 264]|uniref:Phosphoribulokinase/uridine kinase n=1 Tax=Niveomyces insectorum RCEF 264 TaxID=1081102 RepID=A0A168AGK4_9HYPO|nr:phosphoribulokinase/uridine kinase [Niveomyces insectorum RCEF 264]
MDSTYRCLVQRVIERWKEAKKRVIPAHDGGESMPTTPSDACNTRNGEGRTAETASAAAPRVLVALAGPPGCGKTTIAHHVVAALNGLPGPAAIRAVALSADGFHLPRATLAAMPNAEEALRRRGAPWTFDGAGVVALVQALRAGAGRTTVRAPVFDHAVKDPVPGGLVVGPEVEVCILEGNYLLCSEPPWGSIAAMVDDRWLVRVEPALARTRVAARHLQAGIESTAEAALRRADENDLVNGRWVVEQSQGRYDVLIDSIEEQAAKHA